MEWRVWYDIGWEDGYYGNDYNPPIDDLLKSSYYDGYCDGEDAFFEDNSYWYY